MTKAPVPQNTYQREIEERCGEVGQSSLDRHRVWLEGVMKVSHNRPDKGRKRMTTKLAKIMKSMDTVI